MPSLKRLLQRKKTAHKNDFGHVLVLAGSKNMLGAGALSSLAAMRAGAGLVTLGVPKSLGAIAQKKIANVVMTLGLSETKEQTLAFKAFEPLRKSWGRYNTIALGPGLSTEPQTVKLIQEIILKAPQSLVIDADAINAVAKNLSVLKKSSSPKIITPHAGEMARLTGLSVNKIESNRRNVALDFAKQFNVVVLLKGHRTLIASPKAEIAVNTTGNAGMATAGSGDVLTGIIAAFLSQGLSAFDAARYGAYIHGASGDLAAKEKTPTSLIASDIIEYLPKAFAKSS